MEKELNSNETRLFDLIESQDFAALNQADKIFVLKQMTEEEYQFQRKIIAEADTLFEDQISPKPLIISDQTNKEKGIVIPLYQALLAVASVIIIFLIVWPKNEIIDKNDIQLSENDTIIKTKIVHDTFVKYVPEIKFVEKIIPETKIEYVTVYQNKQMEEPRLLEVAQNLNLPTITKEAIVNKGNSLKEDQSSKFIKPIIISN